MDTLSKGGFSGPRWSVELGLGITEVEHDAFNQRLQDFGYICRPRDSSHWKFSAAGFWRWNRNIQWGINFENMESQSVLRKSTHDKPGETDSWWSSSGTGEQQEYAWSSYAVVGNLRAGLPLFRELFVPYVQLGVGVGVALSEFIETISPENNTGKEVDVGYYLSGGAGLLWMPWQRFGFTTEMKYAYSPLMRTLMGDTHTPTGLSFASGLLATF